MLDVGAVLNVVVSNGAVCIVVIVVERAEMCVEYAFGTEENAIGSELESVVVCCSYAGHNRGNLQYLETSQWLCHRIICEWCVSADGCVNG